ncbi:TetR/AcrR family transcriptional regulator [Mesorhizobium xinjiangense]|uniref:TetR/AcrR family transcriptional regulator n=1 Tax=Mesorhizobium xinjiangense TaxID=2678685 RepID=UPI0018DC3977|nr:TetR/AcrR family transcriptional regulator [Mesorhizobium xinjiangense]
MARPKTDTHAVRKRLLEATERLLKAHGPKRITVSDVAAACGMSQSNAYRFFASKQALLEAVGERWFAAIEQELAAIAASQEPPAEQLVRFVVRQYELKRARYAEDPELFRSYLELDQAEMGVVQRHLNRLHAQLEAIVQRCGEHHLLGGRDPGEAAALVEAVTIRFRDPGLIMQHFEADSVRRAAEAAGLILAGLAHLRER